MITQAELLELAKERFGDLVKAVVDMASGRMAVGGELHADMEALFLEQGCKQTDLWGINLYPEKSEEDFAEFDSMINVRPSQGNRSRGVEDVKIQKDILEIVARWVQR